MSVSFWTEFLESFAASLAFGWWEHSIYAGVFCMAVCVLAIMLTEDLATSFKYKEV